MIQKHIVIAGGGAAGFFAAVNIAEKHKHYKITILEKSPKLLEKVRISGGGRCNVTHACFDPKLLVRNYPRGEKELLGPFIKFNPANTVEWFRKRGVDLKKETDGRMFPVTNSSQTIIDCLTEATGRAGVEICCLEGVETLQKHSNGQWQITTTRNRKIFADAVLITTGSAQKMWQILTQLGHSIVEPVPSLFTFNIQDVRLRELSGVSLPKVFVSIPSLKLQNEGAMLITHWGLSGPAVLRLSAWGARKLAAIHHQFDLQVNFTGMDLKDAVEHLNAYRQNNPKKQLDVHPLFSIPERLWRKILPTEFASKKWGDLGSKGMAQIADALCKATFKVNGRSANKEEFVTAGGIALKEVDFRTMQSKLHANLYFAGEVLDIDAITGGFNFQAAWTTAWIASESL